MITVSLSSEEKMETASRMADAIAVMYRKKGNCLPQDLLSSEFTLEEIDLHWSMARALASVAMICGTDKT